MHVSTKLVLGLLMVVGLAAAVVVLAEEARSDSHGHEARAEAFQRLVGGLGFGPCADLSPSPTDFDPRLEPEVAADAEPLLDGAHLAPSRATSVFYSPRPARPRRQVPERRRDGQAR